MIIDYSFWRPNRAELAGVNGVIRYLSRDPAKCATAAELGQLHAWDIATALVFEDTAARAESGAAAGHEDGAFCAVQMAALGVPAGRPVYAAVDIDIPDHAPSSSDPRAKLGPVAAYLEAFAAAVHPYAAGAYGGYWLVSRVADARLAWWLWQTTAWSGGQVDARAALFQPGIKPPGKDADLDFAGVRDWGQFRRVSSVITGPAA